METRRRAPPPSRMAIQRPVKWLSQPMRYFARRDVARREQRSKRRFETSTLLSSSTAGKIRVCVAWNDADGRPHGPPSADRNVGTKRSIDSRRRLPPLTETTPSQLLVDRPLSRRGSAFAGRTLVNAMGGVRGGRGGSMRSDEAH